MLFAACSALLIYQAGATTCAVDQVKGCYHDSGGMYNTSGRVLDGFIYNSDNQLGIKMTQDICMQVCNDRGFKYAGLEDGDQCFCGDTINPALQPLNLTNTCLRPCDGNKQQKCGGYWQVLVLSYICTGPPDGGAPMALMTPCENEGVVDDVWIWDWASLTNPSIGSTICLNSWKTSCLAAEFTHEHARVIVTRNAAKFYYDADNFVLKILPAMSFAISINCAFDEKCVHDGANLLLSRVAAQPGISTQFRLAKFTTPGLFIHRLRLRILHC
jgi:hypothetical protein